MPLSSPKLGTWRSRRQSSDSSLVNRGPVQGAVLVCVLLRCESVSGRYAGVVVAFGEPLLLEFGDGVEVVF